MQSQEYIFIKSLKKSGVCARKNAGAKNALDDDVCVLNALDFKNLISQHSKKYQIIATMDSFCENIHFKRAWLSPRQAIKKAFLVNLSDIIAKNATPKSALLSIVLPKDMQKCALLQMIEGIKEISAEFGIEILGGDSAVGKNLDFHITLFGICVKPLYRANAKKNQRLFCTQERVRKGGCSIGSSYKELVALLRTQERRKAKGRFLAPKPRTSFMHHIGTKLCACMDVSDGILQDLQNFSTSARLGFAPSREFVRLQKSAQKWRLQSGEEYELLFALDSKKVRALKQSAKRARISLLELGRLTRGRVSLHCKKWH
ncbi:thiamine-phosphate kinase [Helicobacter himalayensis]|uniref:thiamine-phosphate kinase n=1 Tax=Helicobacter himalayensis TaxID=1591088 RepID=UPI000A7B31B3|nr:thiamine-phosphate kinase [Helicobacter himalayensis]